jgi:hypothetical protein
MIFLALWFCVGRVSEYYKYVAQLEEILISRYQNDKAVLGLQLERADTFIVTGLRIYLKINPRKLYKFFCI